MVTLLGGNTPGKLFIVGDPKQSIYAFRRADIEMYAGTRREFLWQTGAGFAGVALSGLLQGDGFFSRASAAEPVNQSVSLPSRAM